MARKTIDPDAIYLACESYGAFEVEIPGEAVLDMSCPGEDASEAVASWAKRIERPEGATVDAVRRNCKETGAWSGDELADDSENWHRTLWMLACDVAECEDEDRTILVEDEPDPGPRASSLAVPLDRAPWDRS